MAVADSIAVVLAQATWQAAVIACAVWAVCRVGAKRIPPDWRFALWGLVLLRLACPLLPASPASVYRLFGISERASANSRAAEETGDAVASRSTRLTEQPSSEPAPTPAARPSFQNVPDAAAPAATETQHAATERVGRSRTTGTWRWSTAAVLVWLCGVTGLLVRQFLRWRLSRRAMSAWRPVTDERARQVLEECCRGIHRRRRVRLLVSPGSHGPGTFGVLQPGIVVPQGASESFTCAQLRLIFRHELAHVRRRDVLWDRLATLTCILHWFNPAAWWARQHLREEREVACDEQVLERSDASEVREYGELLIRLAGQHSPATSVAIGSVSQNLERRLRMIADRPRWTFRSHVAGALLLGMVSLCGLTRADPPSEPADAPTKRRASANRQPATSGEPSQEFQIAGECLDEAGRPVEGVRVQLFRVDRSTLSREKVAERRSNAAGDFKFPELPEPDAGDRGMPETYYVLAASKPGVGSRIHPLFNPKSAARGIEFCMSPSGALTGRVTDGEGRPVAGAEVFVQAYPPDQPIDGVLSTTTDADGRYQLSDLAQWDAAKVEPREVDGGFTAVSRCYLTVLHPDFGKSRPAYSRVPSTVDVTLEPAATITGAVFDRVTDRPAGGVLVSMQGVDSTKGSQKVVTDEDGRYRLTSVEAGRYNIWAEAPRRIPVAIDSLEIAAGDDLRGQDVELVSGSWIEGRLVDAETGEVPEELVGGDDPPRVAAYGPHRPKSGAAVVSAPIGEDGRFRIRVAPGENFPYIMQPDLWKRVENRNAYERIRVAEDEVVQLTFRLLERPPRPQQEPVPVRLPLPVPDERKAAAAVRELGGWYEVDEDRHVVQVNMVYHEPEEGVRLDNDQADTAAVLEVLPSFPRLKRVFLKEGQAGDAEMRHVAKLKNLETFFVWDARLSDAGVEHLRNLKTLERIHVDDAGLGDAALAVFGELPNLESLSLQGNAFTDDGLRHLVPLNRLKSLAVGLNRTPYTDAATEHVGRLGSLERLDLQKSRLTDAGIRNLGELSRLRQLLFGGRSAETEPTVTDASVDVLTSMTKLERLSIANARLSEAGIRKLVALPRLERLSIWPTAVSPQAKADLKQKYPDRRLHLNSR